MDLQLNSNFNFVIQNGDFVFNDSNQQELDILLYSNLGNIRSNYNLGIGVINYLNTTKLLNIKSNITKNAQLAGNIITNISCRYKIQVI